MDDPDPGYDDWFDEPAPPTQESVRAGGSGGGFEGDDDAWVLPEDAPRRARRPSGDGDIAIGNLRLTTTQAAILVAAILAVFFGILAAAGVFSNGSKATVPPIRTASLPTTPSTPTTTALTVSPPTQTLKPGATGNQVKRLQETLNALGFPVGRPDGDYGPNTQSAVEQFQSSKGLTADGVLGPQTLSALHRALSAGTG